MRPNLIDSLTEAIAGERPSRSIHEIQSEVFAICRRIESASEAQEWLSLHNLADRLRELAGRAMYHASQAKAKDVSAFALGNHQEQDPR